MLALLESSDSISNHQQKMDAVFANRSKEDVTYPLTAQEIVQAQSKDVTLKKLTMQEKYPILLLEYTQKLWKYGKMVIPIVFQNQTGSWYHHYLQHLGHAHLKRCFMQQCIGKVWELQSDQLLSWTCQINKQHKHKYGKLPTKLVITNPWEVLHVDLIEPYTLKGKDGTEIDFTCLTMIDSASRWFEIVELTATEESVIPMDTRGTARA